MGLDGLVQVLVQLDVELERGRARPPGLGLPALLPVLGLAHRSQSPMFGSSEARTAMKSATSTPWDMAATL